MHDATRATIARALHRWADRLDGGESYRAPGLSFTFEPRVGLVVHQFESDRGCPLWYRQKDYDRAWKT